MRSMPFAALALLSCLVYPAARADDENPDRALVESQLDGTVFTFQGEDVPLETVLRVVAETAEIDVVLDPLVAQVKGGPTAITINVRDLKLKDALKLMLGMNGLDFRYGCGALIVSTPKLLERWPVEPAGPAEGASEEERAIRARLAAQEIGRLEFESHPLAEIVEFLRDNFEINMILDPALARAAPGRTRVTLRVSDLRLDQALTLIACLTVAEYTIEHGVVVIGPVASPLAAEGECPYCGRETGNEEFKFCPWCGERLGR